MEFIKNLIVKSVIKALGVITTVTLLVSGLANKLANKISKKGPVFKTEEELWQEVKESQENTVYQKVQDLFDSIESTNNEAPIQVTYF